MQGTGLTLTFWLRGPWKPLMRSGVGSSLCRTEGWCVGWGKAETPGQSGGDGTLRAAVPFGRCSMRLSAPICIGTLFACSYLVDKHAYGSSMGAGAADLRSVISSPSLQNANA